LPGFEYTIRGGDTLWAIARRHRVSGGWRTIWDDSHNEEIRRLRGNPDRLYAGDRIYIPDAVGNAPAAASGRPATFTVPPPYRIRAEDGSSAPPTVIPKGVTIRLKARHNSGASGSWRWSTPSTKLTLTNETTDTVSIRAGNRVSAAANAEIINLSFTPTGGSALPNVSTSLTIVGVTFAASRMQSRGFDGMGAGVDDATPSGQNPHVSVKKSDTTRVLVRVAGGVTGGFLRFTTDDNTTAEARADNLDLVEIPLIIEGKSKDKNQTLIHARANSDTGPICASLAVNVYRERSYSAKVAKVWDSTSTSTRLSRPNFSVTDTQTALRRYYKPAVCTISLTDYSSTGGALDVNFDPTRTGALVLEAGRTSTGEQRVKNALTGTGTKIVIVKELKWLFKLGAAAARGATTITMSSHLSADYMAYITNDTYEFGGPGNYENITVTACNTGTRVVTLASALTKAHPATEGIWWPLGGLSGNPAFVQESSDPQAKVDEVIGHELGHELLEYKDLNLSECLMHFTNSRTSQKVRFKPIARYYNPPGGNENQWDSITRT